LLTPSRLNPPVAPRNGNVFTKTRFQDRKELCPTEFRLHEPELCIQSTCKNTKIHRRQILPLMKEVLEK
jgi:hypothetical protein